MSKYFTKEVAGNIKRAKYQVKNAEGKYEVVYLETAADQVEETHDRVFVTPEQKAQITSNKEAIEAEKSAREEAVEGLSDRLEVIEGEGEGSVKKALQDAKSYTDGKVSEINSNHQELSEKVSANEKAIEDLGSEFASEIGRIEKAYKDADTTINGRLDSLESETADLEKIRTDIAANTAAINKEVTDREAAVKAVDDKLTAEVSRATAAEVALGKRIDGVESDLTSGLNSTKEYVDGKVSEINTNHSRLAERVTTNEGQLATVDTRIEAAKTEAVNTSKAHTDAEIVKLDAAYKAADLQVLSDANAYADNELTKLRTSLTEEITAVEESVETVDGKVVALTSRVTSNEEAIDSLRNALSNKNSNTIVVNTEDEIAVENPNPKVGDLAYVISSKRAYIFKGVTAIAVKSVPQGWVVFDEITSELDLVDYLKIADANATFRKLSDKIVEGDLHTDLSTKINNKADKSYVDVELAKKTNEAYVNAKVEEVVSPVRTLANQNKTDIANEVTARKSAISTVEAAIATETTNRTQAINTVSSAVTKEVADRKEAIEGVNSTISGVNTKLTQEISARETAVSGVDAKVTQEVKDREAAISGVNTLIETLNSKIAQADALIATLQGKLTTLEEIETNRIVFED